MDKKDFEILNDLIDLFREYESSDKERLDRNLYFTPKSNRYLRNKDMLKMLRRVKKHFVDREKMMEEASGLINK